MASIKPRTTSTDDGPAGVGIVAGEGERAVAGFGDGITAGDIAGNADRANNGAGFIIHGPSLVAIEDNILVDPISARCGHGRRVIRDSTRADGQVPGAIEDGEGGVTVEHKTQGIDIRIDRSVCSRGAEGEGLRAVGEGYGKRVAIPVGRSVDVGRGTATAIPNRAGVSDRHRNQRKNRHRRSEKKFFIGDFRREIFPKNSPALPAEQVCKSLKEAPGNGWGTNSHWGRYLRIIF